MIELFFNEFLSTFPFHILACVPFHKRLRHSPWKTFLWVCGFELGYLLLFMFLRSSRRRLSPPTSHTTGHAVPHPAVQLT